MDKRVRLEFLGKWERIRLKWTLFRIERGGAYEVRNEICGSIKWGSFLENLRNCSLLKKHFSPRRLLIMIVMMMMMMIIIIKTSQQKYSAYGT